jgi:photosystem II stability/assembly factor-like uncharacterized protein
VHGGLQATTTSGTTWVDANWGIQNLFVGALSVVRNGETPIVYAGSDFAVHRGFGGAWDTADQRQGIFDIQADPGNPATLYLGTERSGVWKTENAGQNWTPAATNIVPAQIYGLSQAADGGGLYAATSSGLYASGDGEVWIPLNASGQGIVLSVAADPTRAPLLYAGAADGVVLFSEDGGFTFSNRSNGLPRENIVALTTAPWEKTYAVTTSGGLYATSDQGHNWFAAAAGIAAPVLAITADPVRPWILYAATSGGGVYKSESGSLTWTARNSGLTSPFVFALAVDPQAPATVYAGTLDGLFKSVDAGTTWTRAGSGLAAGAVTTLRVDPFSSAVVYASVQDAGIFRSADRGVSWTRVSTGLPSAGAVPLLVSRARASQLFAGTSLNGVYTSLDAGATWRTSSFGMTLFVRGLAVDPVTPSTLYAGSLGAGVFKSTDRAATWTNVGLRDRNIFKLAVHPTDTARVYAATSQGVSLSIDAGATWKHLGQKAAFVHALVVDPRDRSRLFVGTTAGSVYRSVDGGETWQNASSGLPPYTIVAP